MSIPMSKLWMLSAVGKEKKRDDEYDNYDNYDRDHRERRDRHRDGGRMRRRDYDDYRDRDYDSDLKSRFYDREHDYDDYDGYGRYDYYGYGDSAKMSTRGKDRKDKVDKFDKSTAEEWTKKMKNSDGSTGAHWDMAQTEDVRKQHGYTCDPAEFYAAINMCYSDYYKLAKDFNLNNTDFYARMAHAFLDDEDAGENKIAKYYDCVVK